MRRRFVLVLWLSIALHAAMIGLTRLPPPVAVPLPPEIQVRLSERVRPAPQPVVATAPRPLPTKSPAPVRPESAVSQPVRAVDLPAPQPVAPPVVSPSEAIPAQAQSVPVPPRRQPAPGPEISVPLLADMRFYTAKELDVQPYALRRPDPVYPARAEAQGMPGRVVIRLHLESDGSVSQTEVVSVSPGGVFGDLFVKSTLDAVRGLRFRPAQRNGKPVRAVVEIPVVFEPAP